MINIEKVRYVIVDMKPGPAQYNVFSRTLFCFVDLVDRHVELFETENLAQLEIRVHPWMSEKNRYKVRSVTMNLELRSGRS